LGGRVGEGWGEVGVLVLPAARRKSLVFFPLAFKHLVVCFSPFPTTLTDTKEIVSSLSLS